MGAVHPHRPNITFTHNLVENSQGSGMRIVTTNGDISNAHYRSNLFENIDTVRHDTGAIYLRDTSCFRHGDSDRRQRGDRRRSRRQQNQMHLP